MNKAGGAGTTGGGTGPTAAAAAAAAQKQKNLLQRVEGDVSSLVENFTVLVNVARVNEPPLKNSQEAFMMEVRASKMAIFALMKSVVVSVVSEAATRRGLFMGVNNLVQAADSLLKLVSELKQTAIFSGFASLNDHVDRRTQEFNQLAEKSLTSLATIGEEAAASLKELESHLYSSAERKILPLAHES